MHVGIALKLSTPVEHVFPYCDAGDIDLVSRALKFGLHYTAAMLLPAHLTWCNQHVLSQKTGPST